MIRTIGLPGSPEARMTREQAAEEARQHKQTDTRDYRGYAFEVIQGAQEAGIDMAHVAKAYSLYVGGLRIRRDGVHPRAVLTDALREAGFPPDHKQYADIRRLVMLQENLGSQSVERVNGDEGVEPVADPSPDTDEDGQFLMFS